METTPPIPVVIAYWKIVWIERKILTGLALKLRNKKGNAPKKECNY
jgi:hypothetical protein